MLVTNQTMLARKQTHRTQRYRRQQLQNTDVGDRIGHTWLDDSKHTDEKSQIHKQYKHAAEGVWSE